MSDATKGPQFVEPTPISRLSHMYRDSSASPMIESPTTTSPSQEFIIDEEEVEVHLPESNLEDEGVSFRHELKEISVKNEEEVDAHLPDSKLEDSGVAFRDEKHDSIEK